MADYQIEGVQDDNEYSDTSLKAGFYFVFQGSRLKVLRHALNDIARPFWPFLLKTQANPTQLIVFNARFSGNPCRVQKDRLEICWLVEPQDDHKETTPEEF